MDTKKVIALQSTYWVNNRDCSPHDFLPIGGKKNHGISSELPHNGIHAVLFCRENLAESLKDAKEATTPVLIEKIIEQINLLEFAG